jgi:glycerol-3-phosphate acyltransferase PlsX
MGGDHAPLEVVKGAIHALKTEKDLEIILVGDEKLIGAELERQKFDGDIDIVHTPDWITMDDSPKKALQEKPHASINIAAQLLNEGSALALVTAGNTGATVLSAAQNLSMIDGVERSALAAIYPTAKFHPGSHGFALMLDVGATIHCSSKQLVHFAHMGSYYVSHILGIPQPRVGLLNIGEEESKGGDVMTRTYQYLKQSGQLNFIGNIEGKDIPTGAADVIITEGFVGNVVLKMLEGVGDVLKQTGKYAFHKKLTWKLGLALLSSGVKRLKQKADYSEYGGAPILGFKKLVIKAHGRSNAKAIYNAIRVAKRSAQQDVTAHISESILEFNRQHRIDFLEI